LILVDSSAWIEVLRATESAVDRRLTAALGAGEPLATTGVVMLEVLAGASHERELLALRRLLARCEYLPLQELADHEVAAGLYRACRREGSTVRRGADCLIAAVAVRLGIPVLHCDADFDVLARHTALTVATS
jgi:predicted nucleic acid-binding protein